MILTSDVAQLAKTCEYPHDIFEICIRSCTPATLFSQRGTLNDPGQCSAAYCISNSAPTSSSLAVQHLYSSCCRIRLLACVWHRTYDWIQATAAVAQPLTTGIRLVRPAHFFLVSTFFAHSLRLPATYTTICFVQMQLLHDSATKRISVANALQSRPLGSPSY